VNGKFDDIMPEWIEPDDDLQIKPARDETDSCERGTPGCSIHHTRDSDCQTW